MTATIISPFPSGFSEESLPPVLAWLAEVRPLVAGGHITFFPPELVERLRNADPAVAEESAQRVRLRHSIRRLPNAAKIGSTAGPVGATVLAGALIATPPIGVALGAAGAAIDLAATWLYQWQRHREQQPALRVLAHLIN